MEQGCYYVALKAIRELRLICVKGSNSCHKVTLYVWLDALVYLKHAWPKIGIFTELASFHTFQEVSFLEGELLG